MAKKKENKLTYLQMPLPQGVKSRKMVKIDWSGLNYRNTKDTGEISKELNISTYFAPYLTPSAKKTQVKDNVFEKTISGEKEEKWEKTTYPADICYLKGFYFVQGYYDTTTGSADTLRNIKKGIHQVFDKDFRLTKTVVTDETLDIVSGAGILLFNYFVNNKDITKITTDKRILCFPRSVKKDRNDKDVYKIKVYTVPDVVTLDTHFHNIEFPDKRRGVVESYLKENCTKKNTYYFLECATDKDSDGKPLFPGGTGNNDDINQVKNDSPYNSIYTKIYYSANSREALYFNIKQPYCATGDELVVSIRKNVVIDKVDETEKLPDIHYACVAHQRVFGINKTQVFASGYNNYENWDLDTADSYSAENAWMSSTEGSGRGDNVGIISYGGRVYVFKEESTLEIINTKNPFRITEAFSVGAIGQKGIQVVGNYLIFVTRDGVRLYNGASLKDIGYKLNINKVNSVVSGTDGRKFYMSAEINDEERKRLFVYDTMTGTWAEEDTGEETITITIPAEDENGEETTEDITRQIEFVGFTKSNDGFYGLTSSGKIFKLDTEDYDHEWFVETDFFTNNSVDIKHIKKVQMLSDIAPGSVLRVYILYDDEEFNPETSHKIFEHKNTTEKEIKLPIRVIPRKTASYGFKIRIEGYGFSKIYQMETEITGGGEMNITG